MTYKKRVAFVISVKNLLPHGGLGSFTKSFVEMAKELNWFVDIVVDRKPNKNILMNHLNNMENCSVNFPESILEYTDYTKLFSFTPSLNLELMVNIRTSMAQVLERKIFDLILINDPDCFIPIHLMGISEHIPTVAYTHFQEMIFENSERNQAVMLDCAAEVTKSFPSWSNTIIGTQSDQSKYRILGNFLNADVQVLPMRVPEKALLQEDTSEKSGVLFIGRFDSIKQPKIYTDAIIEAGLPAKILTNANGERKFKKIFDKAGHLDYTIKSNLIGSEKTQFIKSAKLAFVPSSAETYGFNVFESIHCCETFVLSEYNWHKPFGDFVKLTTKKTCASDLKRAYGKESSSNLEMLNKIHDYIKSIWEDFLADREHAEPDRKSQLIEFLEKGQSTLHEYIFGFLERDYIEMNLMNRIYSKLNQIYIYHTINDTYISLDPEFKEIQEDDFWS